MNTVVLTKAGSLASPPQEAPQRLSFSIFSYDPVSRTLGTIERQPGDKIITATATQHLLIMRLCKEAVTADDLYLMLAAGAETRWKVVAKNIHRLRLVLEIVRRGGSGYLHTDGRQRHDPRSKLTTYRFSTERKRSLRTTTLARMQNGMING